ncbi:MAG: hypothetical protein IPJ38_21005 [Dechloromonas sp.]|uniref:Uncharacterized protein n=1 Tax=Candidatus Dechloromonas phosphorivorans TaxID=2899244 RepID=A0A935MZV4_9RHOO|nr:hypothetical protein [Candidatus Dechloromonas phosphorivorans]
MSDNHSMESPKNISGNTSASRLSIANLSVALSFILATLFSAGPFYSRRLGYVLGYQFCLRSDSAHRNHYGVLVAHNRCVMPDSHHGLRFAPNSEWQVSPILFGNCYCAYLVKQAHQQQPMNISPKKYCSQIPTFIVYPIASFSL